MKKNKLFRAGVPVVLCLMLLFSSAAPAGSVNENAKEETVYVLLSPGGAPQSAFVVNSFEHHTAGELSDYGEYTAVRNLSGLERLTSENGRVTATLPEGKFYYEGKLKTAFFPWKVALSYTLDGAAIDGAELAGKSGALEITLAVTPDDEVFSPHYALQISLSLNTALCQNIRAEGATVANAGKNKSLTFTHLPGTTQTYMIQADVRDFEMDSITLAGLPFSLKLPGEGLDELTAGLPELQSGIASLDDGAKALTKGAAELQTGLDELKTQSGTLTTGSAQLLSALNQLNASLSSLRTLTAPGGDIAKLLAAAAQYKDGVAALAAQTAGLPQTSGAIAQGLKQSAAGASQLAADDPALAALIASLTARNDPQINALIAAYNAKTQGAATLAAGLSQLDTQYAAFDGGISQLSSAAQSLKTGYDQMYAGLARLEGALSGLNQLASAVSTLRDQYKTFDAGLAQYTGGVTQAAGGYDKIAAGVNELSGGISALREGVGALGGLDLSGLLSGLTSEFAPVSFVSKQNANVTRVQFVAKTEAIRMEVPQPVAPPAVKKTFIEKLLDLFR